MYNHPPGLQVPSRSFVVGDIFRQHDNACISQDHGVNFEDYVKRIRRRVVPIDFSGMGTLREYVLPEDMKDRDIQSNAHARSMTEQEFLLILYALTIEPELGKYHLGYELKLGKFYLLNVHLDRGTRHMFHVYQKLPDISGDPNLWGYYTYRFNWKLWHADTVFLHFAPSGQFF